MRHNENKQYLYYENSRGEEEEKEAESVCKTIVTENFPCI